MTDTTGPGEVLGLDQSIAYAGYLAGEAGQHGTDDGETYLALLAERRVVGAGITTAADMQQAFTTAAAAAAAHAAELTKQKQVQQAYDACPDAGDKDFQTGNAGAGVEPPGTTGEKGTPVNHQPAGPAADQPGPAEPGRTAAAIRCDTCGYVMKTPPPQDGMVIVEPAGCPTCRTTGTTFSPTDVFYPHRPSEAALERDTRDAEAAIRAAYTRLTDGPGFAVTLTDLRAALPARFDRDTVDAALIKLGAHCDVYVTPRTGHHQCDERTQHAALAMGGGYQPELRIYPDHSMLNTLSSIRSASRVQAESILAHLDDDKVAWLAAQMGVDADRNPAQVRERIAERAERNRRDWLADAEQGRLDGTLLYRADNEPEWVATWTDEDRQKVAAAAARLQHRAATEQSWAYVKDRADRWANPQQAPATA